ncbi:hypothetical protein ACFV8Z_55800 [Streptomyces sp. NPDC059837]|uniref:hypothetical protein n=1 Tax=Streptomyces sp. NPDC059837 TaxID=3346968 RepID=UPI00364B99C1
MLTSTDSTATSAIDGNNSSFNRSMISSTAPNCQPNRLDRGSFSGDFTYCPDVTQRGRVTEVEPEPELVLAQVV